MRRWALLGVALAGVSAGAALAAPPPINADLMTVSGRFGLPSAAADTPRLTVTVAVAPEAAAATTFDPAMLKTALSFAVDKSLRNHALVAPDGLAAAVTLSNVGVERKADSARVVATLSVKGDGACLPYEATGTYRSLSRLKSGNGRRAAGVLATIATLGTDGGAFMATQMMLAQQENRAANAFRTTLEGEGVAPDHGKDAMVRHGATNAIQLAIADVIRHLNGPACTGTTAAQTVAQPSVEASTGTP